jgi:hypothetical protein
VAYIPIYNKKHSVGADPELDHRLGVEHGAVGCGRRMTDKTMSRITWMTIVNGRLIYNGRLTGRLDYNPWSASGRTWHCYKASHHRDLGAVEDVLAAAGVSRDVLPKNQNRFVKDSAAIRALIAFAEAQVA